MLTKQCPQCRQTLSLTTLKSSGTHKAYIKREAFACPHCKASIQLPVKAEKTLSIGLLFSVILAPLSYYWLGMQTLSFILFILGAIFIIIGTSSNQLTNAQNPSNNTVIENKHTQETK